MRRSRWKLRKHVYFNRFRSTARRPRAVSARACGLSRHVHAPCAGGVSRMLIEHCRRGQSAREEKTLDTRKVDRGGASAPRSGTDRRRVPTIDTHTHFMPPSALGPAMAGERWHGIQFGRNARGKITSSVGGISQEIPWPTPIETADARVSSMDERRVDIHLVSISPTMYWYGLDGPDGRELGARHPMTIWRRWWRRRPDRFVGLGYLPLQDPAGSVAELERCVRDLAHAGRHDRHQCERARTGTAPNSSRSCRRPSSSARCSISTRRAAAPIPG